MGDGPKKMGRKCLMAHGVKTICASQTLAHQGLARITRAIRATLSTCIYCEKIAKWATWHGTDKIYVSKIKILSEPCQKPLIYREINRLGWHI